MVEVEEELQRAERDFERGDYIELSRDQLERCIETGESPWPDESRDRARRFVGALPR